MNKTRVIFPRWLTAEAFAPYGQVISPIAHDKPYGGEDARLVLDQGIPRFYLMRLQQRGNHFYRMTRHVQCTQCLGSLADRDWVLAVAPPDNASLTLNPEAIEAFRIPGDRFVKLHVGTWHAGPYFSHESVDFYNLELTDTNVTDHYTIDLQARFGIEIELKI